MKYSVFLLHRHLFALLSLLLSVAAGLPVAQAQAPTITSFAPTSGPAGTVVTVTGTNLTTIRSVVLRGIPCNSTPISASQASFVVSAQASTGPVRLTTTGGTVLSGSSFSVTRASTSLAYVLRSSSFNSIDVGNYSTPAFTDLDHDGLIDLLVGQEVDGLVSHYEQSAANSTSFTLRSTNLSGLTGHYNSLVSVTDIDGDGLLELVVGTGAGNFKHYEQTAVNSTSFTQLANDFNNIFSTGGLGFQVPHFTDIDGDGLLDLLVGDKFLSRYEQTTANGGTFTQLANQNFGPTPDAGNGGAAACVVDLDGDGLLDMLVGRSNGQLFHHEQASANSTSFPAVSTAFNGLNLAGYTTPAITDLDGDGLLDLLVGGADGTLRHYEQAGTPTIININPTSGPVGTSVTITGTNLDGATVVQVNGTAGTIVGTPTATTLTFTVGAGSTTGAVSVTTPGGTATGGTFTVIPPPAVVSVAVPANGTYGIGQHLNFSVSFDQTVTVNTAGGTPHISLTVGASSRQAVYLSGSGSSTLVFRHTVVSGDVDTNGIALGGSISLNGGTIRNAGSTNANLTLNGVASTAGVLVDGVAPTVSISSTAGASGSSTSTSPIPFTVTFSESATGLVIGDIVVTNGSKSGLTGSGPYSFTVTPTGAGAVTVNIAANVATDAGGNGNTAATPFTITYVLPGATITSFTPTSGAVGTSVTITGTNLSSATAVRVNGTAGTITGTPTATSLTFTVGAGSTTGLVSVTTPSGSASSSGSFTVCPPVAIAQDVTLTLDANGTATLLVSQVNNGSQADCGAAPLAALSVSPSAFTCADLGDNTVTLTVTDSRGNSSATTAQVQVVVPVVATTTWLGEAGTDWTACGNWSYGKQPDAGTNVVIPAGTTTYPVLGSGTFAVNNLTVATGASFALAASTTLEVNGNWTSNGSTTLPGTVRFVGSAATQTVGGNTPAIFTTLVMNKPAGGVTLSQHLRVNGSLTLTSGILTTTASYGVTLGSGGTISETGTAYVTGTVQTTRTLSTAGATTTFGGLGLRLTPAGAVLPGVTTVTRVTGTQLSRMNGSHSIARYYTIDAATDSGLNATLVFGYQAGELAGFAETDLTLFRSATGLSGPWQPMGYSSRDATANTVNLNNVSHFSTWTLGSLNAPLPVELVAFTAGKQGTAVALSWRTASEQNSARFEVERSTDSRAFTKIGSVAAQGNKANPTDYTFFDHFSTTALPHPFAYYRLRQVDTNGTASYSPVRVMTLVGASRPQLVLLPNPARLTTMAVGLPAGAEVVVFDGVGRRVAAATTGADGTAVLPLPAGLPAGVYAVRSGRSGARLLVE